MNDVAGVGVISRRSIRRRLVLAAMAVPAIVACGDAAAPGVGSGTVLILTSPALPPLDAAREGTYEAWGIDGAGSAYSLGRFAAGRDVRFVSPADDLRSLAITVERPGDADASPSAQRVLVGSLRGGRAELTVADALTRGGLLHRQPGTFTMFSPSDNAAGYPSHEEAGVWLFNVRPRETPQNDMWVRLTPLHQGWTYEGWMVRDLGTPNEIWLSYGKFVPDATGALSEKDDTGWGPFSGIVNFRTESIENFPGDDWISNPLGYPFPSELTLPLDLREKNESGAQRWTHVITVEPSTDRGEPIGSERPFVVRPYRDSFGDGGAGVPRPITYRDDTVPRAVIAVQ